MQVLSSALTGEQIGQIRRDLAAVRETGSALWEPYFPHSTEFSGGAPTPFVIPLQLCSLTPILGHHLQQLSNQRVTHAQRRSSDPREPNYHH
jgi:hypothetical protein